MLLLLQYYKIIYSIIHFSFNFCFLNEKKKKLKLQLFFLFGKKKTAILGRNPSENQFEKEKTKEPCDKETGCCNELNELYAANGYAAVPRQQCVRGDLQGDQVETERMN